MNRIECERHYKEKKGDWDQSENAPSSGIDSDYIQERLSQKEKFHGNHSNIDGQEQYGTALQRAVKESIEQSHADEKIEREQEL